MKLSFDLEKGKLQPIVNKLNAMYGGAIIAPYEYPIHSFIIAEVCKSKEGRSVTLAKKGVEI